MTVNQLLSNCEKVLHLAEVMRANFVLNHSTDFRIAQLVAAKEFMSCPIFRNLSHQMKRELIPAAHWIAINLIEADKARTIEMTNHVCAQILKFENIASDRFVLKAKAAKTLRTIHLKFVEKAIIKFINLI